VSANAGAGNPDEENVTEYRAPIVAVSLGEPEIVGTEPTVSTNDCVSLPSTLVAIMTTGNEPSVVGVPDTTPFESIVTPVGKPETENVDEGFAGAEAI